MHTAIQQPRWISTKEFLFGKESKWEIVEHHITLTNNVNCSLQVKQIEMKGKNTKAQTPILYLNVEAEVSIYNGKS